MRVLLFILVVYLSPDPAAEYWARYYDIPPNVFREIILVESNNDPFAVGGSGERGFCQIIPGTADYIAGSTNMNAWEILNDPEQNIRAGAWLFSIWIHRFGSVDLALSAYNGGARYVIKHNTVNPITAHYVWKIRGVLNWNWPERVCVDNSGRCLEEDR